MMRALVIAPFVASLLMVLLTPWCTRDRVPAEAFVDAAPTGERVVVHPPWRDDVARALPNATTALAPRQGDPLDGLVIMKERGGVPLPRAIEQRVVSREVRGAIEILRTESPSAAQRDLSERISHARVVVREGAAREPGPGGPAPAPAPGPAPGLGPGGSGPVPGLVPGSGDVECRWSPAQQRHVCEGLPEWMYVGVQDLPVGGREQRCVWAHPRTGAVLAIELADAPLLDTLALSLAITDPAADNARAAPVKAQLFVDDKMVSTLVRDPGRRGFVTARAPSVRGEHDVRVEITTPHDGQRHACFRLVTEASE